MKFQCLDYVILTNWMPIKKIIASIVHSLYQVFPREKRKPNVLHYLLVKMIILWQVMNVLIFFEHLFEVIGCYNTSGRNFPRSSGSCRTHSNAASYIFSSEHTDMVSLEMILATSVAPNWRNSSVSKTSVKWLSMYWWAVLSKSWQPWWSANDYKCQ